MKDITLDFIDKNVPWTLILSKNAIGKTTLLRSIAIRLCNQAEAAGLLKEFEEGFFRRNENEAKINM